MSALDRYRTRLHISRRAESKKARDEIESASGEVIRRIPLTAIRVDRKSYPPQAMRRAAVKEVLNLLFAGKKLPPVKVTEVDPADESIKEPYILMDGCATFMALQERAKLYRDGKLSGFVSQVDLETIWVEVLDAPDDQITSPRLRNRVRGFFRKYPGFPESRAAKELKCDMKTIKKYAADLIRQWKEDRTKVIKKMSSEGKSSRAIARELKLRWPWARGISQPAVNRTIRTKDKPQ